MMKFPSITSLFTTLNWGYKIDNKQPVSALKITEYKGHGVAAETILISYSVQNNQIVTNNKINNSDRMKSGEVHDSKEPLFKARENKLNPGKRAFKISAKASHNLQVKSRQLLEIHGQS